MTNPTLHRICNGNGQWIADVPWQNDDNHGLPQWFFEGDFINFEVTPEQDKVQWWPACGSAPHWTAKLSSFDSFEPLFKTWDAWAKETY